MTRRAILKTIFEPFVIVVAAVYFALDALALSSLKPFLKKIDQLKTLQVYRTVGCFTRPLPHSCIVFDPPHFARTY